MGFCFLSNTNTFFEWVTEAEKIPFLYMNELMKWAYVIWTEKNIIPLFKKRAEKISFFFSVWTNYDLIFYTKWAYMIWNVSNYVYLDISNYVSKLLIIF